jgi:hypothetical protein
MKMRVREKSGLPKKAKIPGRLNPENLGLKNPGKQKNS